MGFAVSLEALRRRQFLATAALAAERTRFRDLLVRVLPTSVADRLQKGEVVADLHMQVAVLFADIVGFAAIAAPHPPEVVVGWLNRLFEQFDRIIDAHGLEKIKTIARFMAAHGQPLPRPIAFVARWPRLTCGSWPLKPKHRMVRRFKSDGLRRTGICRYNGDKRFLMNWGDTVNVASRMWEGIQGGILVTKDVQRKLENNFEFGPFEVREIKGSDRLETWLLGGLKQ